MSRGSILFRGLSVVTLVEASAGLFWSASGLFNFGAIRPLMKIDNPRFDTAFYAMTSADLVFVLLLFASAYYLWNLQRKGLQLLMWTLFAEAVYFVAVAFADSYVPGLDQKTVAAATGIGNMALGVQLITAFPLFAFVLIFLTYRYLGRRSAKGGTP